MSSRLRRLHTEPAEEITVAQQVMNFIVQCVREGINDDDIVTLCRNHPPSQAYGEYGPLNDHSAEVYIARARGALSPELEGDDSIIDWTTMSGATDMDPDFCLGSWVRQGDNVALVGEAKVGKSLFVLDACAAKAGGREFLGEPSPAGAIVYWDCENRPQEVAHRLAAMGYGQRDLLDLQYVSFPNPPRLDTAQGAEKAMNIVSKFQASLFVIDTVQRVIAGEEESSTGIRNMYQHLVAPLRASNVTVLRIDHLGKDPRKGPRGSSAKVDDVDESYQLTASTSGLLHLRATHSRYLRPWGKMTLRREGNPLRHSVVDVAANGVDQDDADESASASTLERALTAPELIKVLDDLGCPDDIGRPTAITALKQQNIKFRTDPLAEAVRVRKERSRR